VRRRSAIAAVRAALRSDERIAHVLGGVMFMAGGLGTAALVLAPGSSGSHETLALLVGLGGLVYGAISAFVLPWERMPFLMLHAAGVTSLVVIVATAAWTGGAESPIRFLAVFVVVWAACFCRDHEIAVYVVLASATFLVPLLRDPSLDAGPFLREQLVVLPALAAVAATVALLRNSLERANARAARAAAQEHALLRVATAVADAAPTDDVLAMVAREAAQVMQADQGAVMRIDGDDAVLAGVWTGDGGDGGAYPLDSRFPLADAAGTVAAVAGGRPVQQRADRDPMSGAALATGQGAVALAPVLVPEGVWGVISVSTRAVDGLAPDAADRLKDFAALVSTAILDAEQRDRLAAQAFADPLTGLANHRAFHERLAAEAERARRHGRDLSLVLVDVDSFKAINDSAGHEAGDRVLSQVAQRLSSTGRGGDLLARIGGDEFAWLLPETTAEDALTLVERARDAVSGAPVDGGASITISAGICDLSRAGDADALFRLADGALYWSKAHGRDTAHVYDLETVRELSAAERAEQLARHQALLGIRALARAIDAKDPTTREHSGRVAELACALARARGWDEERVRLMEEAALVHDVGKIGIPDAILLKPGRLTEAEYDAVKRHAELGAQIVEDVLTPEQVAWIRGHHERPDGRGYPDGLTGEEISEGAALLALADAFDVMTAERSYSPPKPRAEAIAECRELAGRQFTADAVAALTAVTSSAPLPS